MFLKAHPSASSPAEDMSFLDTWVRQILGVSSTVRPLTYWRRRRLPGSRHTPDWAEKARRLQMKTKDGGYVPWAHGVCQTEDFPEGLVRLACRGNSSRGTDGATWLSQRVCWSRWWAGLFQRIRSLPDRPLPCEHIGLLTVLNPHHFLWKGVSGPEQMATPGPRIHNKGFILTVELLQEDAGREESPWSTQATSHLTQKCFLKD